LVTSTIYYAGSLEIVSLVDRPNVLRYEALSYVWGDPAIKHAVEVDGKELFITTNLGAALRRLRRLNVTRIMRVDAICIDQDNIEERSAQLQLMARIYHGASSVVIWLG
jgi:Heterokaryon incompatibility protein (HET)